MPTSTGIMPLAEALPRLKALAEAVGEMAGTPPSEAVAAEADGEAPPRVYAMRADHACVDTWLAG